MDLENIFDSFENAKYGIMNNARNDQEVFGSTPEELGQYLQRLGQSLISTGADIEAN